MESFAARFPRIYLDSSFKGWFVSSLLLSLSTTRAALRGRIIVNFAQLPGSALL